MNEDLIEIYKKIKTLGDTFNYEIAQEVYKIYIPILRAVSNENIEIERDISYGPHSRNLFDIHYLNKNLNHKKPAIVYLHGGGFTRGNKNVIKDEPDLIHGNIANFFAKNDLIGINATYRLAPENQWPSGAEDVQSLIVFLMQNSDKLGINPNKIFVFGQSAGASHVASYLFDKSFNNTEKDNIAGAILFSGAYDLDLIKTNAVEQYYGKNKNNYYMMSSINSISTFCCPLFVTTSEFDPPIFKTQSERLIQKLQENGHQPIFKILHNHNHISQVIHFNTQDNSITSELIKFIKDNI